MYPVYVTVKITNFNMYGWVHAKSPPGEFFQVKEEGGLARMTLFCRFNCKIPYSEGDGAGQGRGLSRTYSFLVSSIQCEKCAGCSLSTHVIYYMVVVIL